MFSKMVQTEPINAQFNFSAFDAPLTTSSGLGGATGSSSSSKKVSSYSSSSYSSSSTGDGKRPVVESSYDSTYRYLQS